MRITTSQITLITGFTFSLWWATLLLAVDKAKNANTNYCLRFHNCHSFVNRTLADFIVKSLMYSSCWSALYKVWALGPRRWVKKNKYPLFFVKNACNRHQKEEIQVQRKSVFLLLRARQVVPRAKSFVFNIYRRSFMNWTSEVTGYFLPPALVWTWGLLFFFFNNNISLTTRPFAKV